MNYYVYILTNETRRVLYTGVTNNLIKRVYQHKEKYVDGFTKKYGVDKLVYYELFDNIEEAIKREKQIKAGNRKRKIKMIDDFNPAWNDLYNEIIQ